MKEVFTFTETERDALRKAIYFTLLATFNPITKEYENEAIEALKISPAQVNYLLMMYSKLETGVSITHDE